MKAKASKTAQSAAATSAATAVMTRLMARIGQEVSVGQAQSLWAECRPKLLEMGLNSTIAEIERSADGHLDTLPREDLMCALGMVLVGRTWPSYGMGEAYKEYFFEALHAGFAARGIGVQDDCASAAPRAPRP